MFAKPVAKRVVHPGLGAAGLRTWRAGPSPRTSALACAGLFALACGGATPLVPPSVDISGVWSGPLTSSRLGTAAADFRFTQTAASATGDWLLRTGAVGTAAATVSGAEVRFTLTETTALCAGSFQGTGSVAGNTMTLAFTGTDCLGAHTSGAGTLTRPDASTSVTGTAVDTFERDEGELTQARNLTGAAEALWRDTTGAFTRRPLAGTGLGTFSIPGVPAGPYYLRFDTTYYITSARTLDLSATHLGRPDVGTAAAGTTLLLSGTGLATWQDNDDLQLISINAGVVSSIFTPTGAQLTAGDTGVSAFEADWSGLPLIDQGLGDRAHLAHLVARQTDAGHFYRAVGQMLPLSPFALVDGSSVSADGAFTEVTQDLNASFELRGAPWEALRTAARSDALTASRALRVVTLPAAQTRGVYGTTLPLAVVDLGAAATDASTGTVNFGNPYPTTWPLVASAQVDFMVAYQVPGARFAPHFVATASRTDLIVNLVTEPIAPLIGAPRNFKLNGADGAVDVTATGVNPTVSWDAPASGTAHFYTLTVTQLDMSSGRPARILRATVHTRGTSVVIPPDVLTTGGLYVLKVGARHMPGSDLENRPFARSLPSAAAETLSGLVTP